MDSTQMLDDFVAFVAILWPLLAAGFGSALAMGLILAMLDPFRVFIEKERG
jgi:hypothetical protein